MPNMAQPDGARRDSVMATAKFAAARRLGLRVVPRGEGRVRIEPGKGRRRGWPLAPARSLGWKRSTRLRTWGRNVGSMGNLNGKYYTNPLVFWGVHLVGPPGV